MVYSKALPVTRFVRYGVTIGLLSIADILAFMPAAYGFLETFPTARIAALFRVAALFAVVGNILLLQLGVVERSEIVTLAAIAAVWPLSLALTVPDTSEAWLLLLFAICCPVAALCAPDRLRLRLGVRVRLVSQIKAFLDRRVLGHVSPPLRIQVKALCERPIISGMMCGAAFGIAEGVDALLSIFSYDGRSLPVVIAGMAVTALIISGLYRDLHQAHSAAEGFWSALPIARHFWAVRDVLLLISIGFIPMVMLLFPLMDHGLASSSVTILLGAGYLALLSALRMTVAKGGRFSVMSSVAIAIVWASSAIAAVV